MSYAITNISGVTVVTLKTSVLGRPHRASLKKGLAGAMDFSRPTILDFGVVENFDCAGLSLIVYWMAESRSSGGTLVLFAASARLRALIDLVRIPTFVPVVSSMEEALTICHE